MKKINLFIILCLLFASGINAQITATLEYKYDAFNRLTETADGTNTTVYEYDELGNRTQQSVSVTLSVSKNEILGLKLYPNPTPKLITITSKSNIDKVVIYDVLGKLVKQQKNSKNTIEIDISGFSIGLYHFVIFSEGKKQSLKVVKQ